MAREQTVVELKHIQARDFRVAVADNTTVTMIQDALGTTYQMTFTRLDVTPILERFQGVSEEGGMRQVSPSEFEMPPRRVQEAGVLMRPDHLYALAMTLVQKLTELPEEQRKRYGIPEIREIIKQADVEK